MSRAQAQTASVAHTRQHEQAGARGGAQVARGGAAQSGDGRVRRETRFGFFRRGASGVWAQGASRLAVPRRGAAGHDRARASGGDGCVDEKNAARVRRLASRSFVGGEGEVRLRASREESRAVRAQGASPAIGENLRGLGGHEFRGETDARTSRGESRTDALIDAGAMRARLVRRRAEKLRRDARRASRSRRRGAPAKRAARDGGPQPRTRADTNLVPHGSRKAPQSARTLGVRRHQARTHHLARAGVGGKTHASQAAHVRRAQKSRRRANRGECLFRVWTFVLRRRGGSRVRRLRFPDALASARRLRRREQQRRQRRRRRSEKVPQKSFRRVVEG